MSQTRGFDIVNRLRANLDKYPGFNNLNSEAAAEIERLRAALAEVEAENKRLRELLRRIADCDWLPEHDGMSVHEIARAALGEKP